MDEQKPKSVNIIGLFVAIFSGFIIFSNGMGALAFSLIGFGNEKSEFVEPSEFNLIGFLFENYILMCLIMVIVGITYFVAGLNIRKYKLWANRLVTYISLLLIALLWTIMISMSTLTVGVQGFEIFRVVAIILAIVMSTPIILIIWFLNKEKIRKHFA